MTKLTKQGVRDLNYIKGKPRGVVLPEPPVAINCRHTRNVQTEWGDTKCPDCGQMWDWNGDPY